MAFYYYIIINSKYSKFNSLLSKISAVEKRGEVPTLLLHGERKEAYAEQRNVTGWID